MCPQSFLSLICSWRETTVESNSLSMTNSSLQVVLPSGEPAAEIKKSCGIICSFVTHRSPMLVFQRNPPIWIICCTSIASFPPDSTGKGEEKQKLVCESSSRKTQKSPMIFPDGSGPQGGRHWPASRRSGTLWMQMRLILPQVSLHVTGLYWARHGLHDGSWGS